MPGNEQYIISRAIVSHLAERPDPSREVLFWIDADTKVPYVSDGQNWNQLGGGGAVSDATPTTPGVMLTDVAPSGAHPVALTTDGLPGLSSDGVSLPGIDVAGGGSFGGALSAGADVTGGVWQHGLVGYTTISESAQSSGNGFDTLDVIQQKPLTAPTGGNALWVGRTSTLNGYDFTDAVLRVEDDTASTAALFRVMKNGQDQLRVDTDGVQIHGKYKTGSAVAHTLGTYSGFSEPVYNEAGTLLGYRPLYN